MATTALRPALAAERRFFLGMAIVMLAIVFAGFAPTWFLRGLIPTSNALPPRPLNMTVALHGAIFSGWVVLFMAQVSLVSAGRTDLHRRLGQAGFAFLPAMMLIGLLAGLEGVARASGPPGIPPLAWLAVPLFDVPVFTALIATGLVRRREPQVHKRFMLAAMISMLPPAIGRMPIPGAVPPPLVLIGGQILFLAALAVWDVKSRGRVHWVTGATALVLVGSWVLRLAIWETRPWLAFAAWVSGPFTG